MRSHKILEHTADIRLQVQGDSLEELFMAAVEGMAEIVKPGACKDFTPAKEKEITVSSPSVSHLLIDFLSEVLTHTHIDETVYCKVQMYELDESSARAKIVGEKVDMFDEDIKAVTYHEADVHKNDEGNYESLIVFDI